MKIAIKLLAKIAIILVGGLFIFSGLIKANDPMGFGIKLQEYFEVFHMTWLNPAAYSLSIFFCGLEVILGIFLLLGIRKKLTLILLIGLIIFFTFLTFYSAVFKVVTTCGCFGDAIPLTPWSSFGKDVALTILILFIFFNKKAMFSFSFLSVKRNEIIVIILACIFSFGVGIYTYNTLPFKDFLPYKVGNNLPALMEIPPGAPTDEYEITFDMQNVKTGETLKVSDTDYISKKLYQNKDLKIVGRTNRLIKAGYQPKIQDFHILDPDNGSDVTYDFLDADGYVIFIVFHNISESSKSAFEKINQFVEDASQYKNIKIIGLTSSSKEELQKLVQDEKIKFPVYLADPVPLKSMVRANPGIIILKKGTILGKWHYHTLPLFKQIKGTIIKV